LTTTVLAGILGGATTFGQSPPKEPTAPASAAKPTETTAPRPVGKININTADEAALMTLQGIGKSKAKAILEFRQKNGNFKTVDDLTKVKGIGETTLDHLRDQLTVE